MRQTRAVSFILSFAAPPPDLHYDGVDVRLVSVTYAEGQITTRLRIYNGRSETLHFTQDDIWLVLGYAPDPPGPRNPAEGLMPFDLLPEQAVDLTLVWYWGGRTLRQHEDWRLPLCYSTYPQIMNLHNRQAGRFYACL